MKNIELINDIEFDDFDDLSDDDLANFEDNSIEENIDGLNDDEIVCPHCGRSFNLRI